MSIASLLCSAVLALSMPRAEYACRYMDLLVKEAEKNDIEPEIFVALIHRESRWKPWAESGAGACGLTQVIPRYGRPKTACVKLKRPRTSIKVGAKTLAYWIYEYGRGDYKKGLCGYNGGYKCGRYSEHYAHFIINYAEAIREQMKRRRMLMEVMSIINFNVENQFTFDKLKKSSNERETK
tara:strand:- start:355 stop:897 length:543 start_codon:yes stop_codon:yes gene_type:complete